MVEVLIRMKLAAMRQSSSDMRILGLIVGVLSASGTLALGWSAPDDTSAATPLFAAAFAGWTLGWVVIPLFVGRDPLRPEYFALLPIPPIRLAAGLLVAAFVGVLPTVTVIAFFGLILYGARLGAGEAIIAVVAMLLQLVSVVLLSKVVVGFFGEAMKSRFGREIIALQFGLISVAIVVPSVGWVVLPLVGEDRDLGRNIESIGDRWVPVLSDVARFAPSGWGPEAVAAAGRSNWVLAIALLAGLVMFCALLLRTWSRLLIRRTTTRASSGRTPGHATAWTSALIARIPATPVGGVIRKEIRTWIQDPWRALELRTSLWTGALVGLGAALLNLPEVLPYVGAIVAFWAILGAANLYGLDGSALWHTLITPGAERNDVRGRQWAWLLLFAPISILITVVLTVASQQSGAWPWALAALPAILGGGAGLAVLVSVFGLAPVIEPQRRSGAFDSTADNTLQLMLTMFGGIVVAIPAVGVVAAGNALENGALRWAGMPVGVGTGALFAWGFGHLAIRRLETHGPELLLLIRGGRTQPTKKVQVAAEAEDDVPELPRLQNAIVITCWNLFWLPLFPQGIVPLVMKLSGTVEGSFFVVTHVSSEYQYPFLALMIALGLALVGVAVMIPIRHHNQHRPR